MKASRDRDLDRTGAERGVCFVVGSGKMQAMLKFVTEVAAFVAALVGMLW